MRFFDQKFSLVILFLTLLLLFLPKINLIRVDSEETAGLRIDDLVLFFVGILLVWSHALSHQRIYKIEGWLLLIIAFSFLSFISNRILISFNVLFMDAKIFYVIRLLEYFLFFYVGSMASHYFKGSVIIRTFFLWNVGLMILQKFNLAGAIASTGYHEDVSGRVQGIASFPSEMGLLLNLLFCYMIYDETTSSRFVNLFTTPAVRFVLRKFYLFWMFCLFAILVILTGNRISIFALVICFLFRIIKELNLRSIGSLILIMTLIPLVLIIVGFIMMQTAGVYQRSLDLFSFKNIELFGIVWDKIDITKALIDNEIMLLESYDMSWFIRIQKWLFVMKSYLSQPICYLQGLGPGFCGAALDGGILRILTENGLIGAFLFWKFFSLLYHLNQQAKWMIIAFVVNMIFFDAYLAYKTMSLLFFTCGYIFAKQQTKESQVFYIPQPA